MRIVRWVAGAAVVVCFVLMVLSQATRGSAPWWLGFVPAGVYVVLVVLQSTIGSRHRRPALRSTVAPGVQGLDEVQGLYLGRPQGLTVGYGDDEPTATALVVDHPDPLDQPRWTIEADGSARPEPPA